MTFVGARDIELEFWLELSNSNPVPSQGKARRRNTMSADNHDDKKYHIAYKTVNTISEKYYYGIHSTDDLCDNYLGSGEELEKDIKDLGRDKFRRKILKFFSSRSEAKEYERELVGPEQVSDPMCYNQQLGG